jgi:hypothetical protein
MVPQTFYALALAARALLPGGLESGRDALQPEPQAVAARYEAASREVTNWRSEAMGALEPKPVVAMVALFRAERPFVTAA